MNFHMNAIKINVDKILTVIVALLIITYIIIMMTKEFDFSSIKKGIKAITNQISMTEVYNYLESHSDYYYKIDGSVYCITKEELINSNEISQKFINSMQGNILEVEYKENIFNVKYNENCIER